MISHPTYTRSASKEGWCFYFDKTSLVYEEFSHLHEHFGAQSQSVLHVTEPEVQVAVLHTQVLLGLQNKVLLVVKWICDLKK